MKLRRWTRRKYLWNEIAIQTDRAIRAEGQASEYLRQRDERNQAIATLRSRCERLEQALVQMDANADDPQAVRKLAEEGLRTSLVLAAG